MAVGRERWGRVLFFVSVLALLATSKPRGWSIAAAVSGPTTAYSSGQALQIEIDSSAEPRLRATGIAKAYSGVDAPCLFRWTSGAKVTCLLPPGAALASVEIRGECGGCQNGCPPPPGSYVRAVASGVAAWTDTTSAALPATLPSHGPKMIASLFEVRVSGAQFIQVAATITAHTGGPPPPPLMKEEQSCEPDRAAPPPSLVGLCRFLIFDADVPPPKTAVDFTAEATGWGACGTSTGAGTTCGAPKTLHVDSVRLAP